MKNNTQPIIRSATIADLPACAKIINDWIDDCDWLPRIHSRDEVAGFFNGGLLKKRTFLIAEIKGSVAGYMGIDSKQLITAFYLDKPHRDRGFGKTMMDDAKARFSDRLELGVWERNTGARKFYEREGFIEIPDGRVDDTEEGVPELLMRWEGEK